MNYLQNIKILNFKKEIKTLQFTLRPVLHWYKIHKDNKEKGKRPKL